MLDLKPFEESRRIAQNNERLSIINDFAAYYGKDRIDPLSVQHVVETYQMRYTVHRQYVGFWTPVIFDVEFRYAKRSPTDQAALRALNIAAEPYVEGAVFMNHTSDFIVDMLRGGEAGVNRKHVVEDIRKNVQGTDNVWYSDMFTPPPTKQSSRLVVYDLDVFGSMLDPINATKRIVERARRLIAAGEGASNIGLLYSAAIVAGYTSKTV